MRAVLEGIRVVEIASELGAFAGKLLADRSLSRLLKKDWPKTLDELEARQGGPPAR